MNDVLPFEPLPPIPDELDILPLFGAVIYPQTVVPLAVAQPAAVRLLAQTAYGAQMIGLLALHATDRRPDPVRPEDCYRVGTVALAHRLLRLPDETLRVAVQGLERFEIVGFVRTEPTLRARIRPLPPVAAHDTTLTALVTLLKEQTSALAQRLPSFNSELLTQISLETEPQRLAYLVAAAAMARRSVGERQGLLELSDVGERLERLSALLNEELQIFRHRQDSPAEGAAPNGTPHEADSTSGAAPEARPGSALWLRWTATGGACAAIEAAALPGGKTLRLTGQRGAALRDAADLALAWVRSEATRLGLAPRFYDDLDLHLHIPPGAAPDDAAAAGLPIAVALASLLLGRPVTADTALAGEITLHGRVLPLGRVREKVLAAQRDGIRRCILPANNAADLASLPESTRDDCTFVFVERVEDAVREALGVVDPWPADDAALV